jgi:HAD superfamily hydrolase (TIGR01509 family)
MIKAIIFDFDGVIVDTELNRFKFIQKELARHNILLDDSILPDIFGIKTSMVLRELVPNISEDIIKEINLKGQKIIKEKIVELKPLPNIKPLLKLLNLRYKIGLTTGSKSMVVNKFLEHNDLLKYFAIITTGEMFKSSKPYPECYLLTLKKLNIQSSEAIIIEDSKAGIMAGKNSGCKVFGLKNQYNSKQIKYADKVFNDYKEMLKYFKENS